MSIISLLLKESEVKPRKSVNNKDIIRMYLGYNWLITQKTLPIKVCSCSPIKASFVVNNLFILIFLG